MSPFYLPFLSPSVGLFCMPITIANACLAAGEPASTLVSSQISTFSEGDPKKGVDRRASQAHNYRTWQQRVEFIHSSSRLRVDLDKVEDLSLTV